MNVALFKEWSLNMLIGLEEGCIIITKNASYHSMFRGKIPSRETCKAHAIAWLEGKKY
jgi:hypothetical protein